MVVLDSKRERGIEHAHSKAKKAKLEAVIDAEEGSDFMRIASSLDSDTKIPNAVLKEKYDDLCKCILGSSHLDDEAAECVTRLVLDSQRGRQIYQLLSPSASSTRIKSALRLLAVCATSSSQAARCIIQRLDFSRGQLPQVAVIKNLTVSAPSANADDDGCSDNNDDARSTFVTLVFALVVGQQWLQVRGIIDNCGALQLVMQHVQTDRCSLIVFILSSLKSAFLDNSAVSKKEKLKVFNSRNMSAILSLYEWRGQKFTWNFSKKFQKRKKNRSGIIEGGQEGEMSGVDTEELEVVRQCVHEFLLLLFTSYRQGIVFRDTWSQSSETVNPVLLALLALLRAPWSDSLKQQLISRTLCCCPALCGAYYGLFANSLDSAPTAEWLSRVRYLCYLIEQQQLTLSFDDASAEQNDTSACLHVPSIGVQRVCLAVLDCYYPSCVRQACAMSYLNHEQLAVRRCALTTLLATLRRLASVRDSLVARGHAHIADALVAELRPLLPSCGDVLLIVASTPAPVQTTAPTTIADTADDTDIGDVEAPVDVLLLCAQTCVLSVRVINDWLHSGSVVSAIVERCRQWRRLISTDLWTQVDASVAELGASDASCVPPPNCLTRQHVDQIISDVTAADTKPSSVGAAVCGESADNAGTSPSARSLMQYMSECRAAMQSQPVNIEALRAWSARAVAECVADAANEAPTSLDWRAFIRQMVEQSLQQPQLGALLLPHLAELCCLFPCNHTDEPARRVDSSSLLSAETVFHWFMSHSLLIGHLLDVNTSTAEDPCSIKTATLRVLLALVGQCHHVCKSSHVALYLCAYDCSMSQCDRVLFQLIESYQRHTSLTDFCPPVWAGVALSFYTPTPGGGCSVSRQRPAASDVISLLEPSRLHLTCKLLQPSNVSLAAAPGSSSVVEEEDDGGGAAVYDVRFLLSVLVQLTADEQPACDVAALMQRGVGSLLVCLLACRRAHVRLAACCVLARLHGQLSALLGCRSQQQRRRRPRAVLWLSVIELLRESVATRTQDTAKASSLTQACARLPFVVAYTWSRMLDVLSSPSHRMFSVVCRHVANCVSSGRLCADRVPLFFELFNSRSECEHRQQRQWLLDTITPALRDGLDYRALARTAAFKSFMSQLGCRCLVSASADRVRLVRVIEACVRVPRVLWRLDTRHGLLSWLSSQTSALCEDGGASRAALISLLHALVESLVQIMSASRRGSGAATHCRTALCLSVETLLVSVSNRCHSQLTENSQLHALLTRVSSLMTPKQDTD